MNYSLDELQKLSSVISNLSSAIIALVSIYASLSYRRWRREEVERRRASIAQNCVEHLERFISKMERLVETQQNMKYREWGKAFYEAYDEHFKSAEIEADTLANDKLKQIFEQADNILKELPLSYATAASHDDESEGKGSKENVWEQAAKETKEKINNVWDRLQAKWKEIKEMLEKEALIVN